MNGEGQRPPSPPEPAQAGSDAPEPGNARYPQPGQNGVSGFNGQQQGQPGEGGGRRRFRRQRRGGRGRRGKGGGGQHGQNQVQPPLDAQGRIVDVENDDLDEGGPDEGPETPADGNVAAPPQPAPQQASDGNVAPPAPAGTPAPAPVAEGQPPAVSAEGAPQPAPQQQQQQPQQQGQQQRHQHQQRHQQRQQQQQQRQEPVVPIEGVLDVDHRGNGRLRTAKFNFLPQQDDPDVPRHIIDRDKLRPGVALTGQAVRRNGRLQLIKTDTVEGLPPLEAAKRTAFQNLTVIDPDDRLVMETTTKELITRVIDIVAPIGLGQRVLIVSPPKAGKTIMLQKICAAITANQPDVSQFVLLVDERPEEVTDFRRDGQGATCSPRRPTGRPTSTCTSPRW